MQKENRPNRSTDLAGKQANKKAKNASKNRYENLRGNDLTGAAVTTNFRLGRGDITRQHNIDAIVTLIPTDLSMDGNLNQSILDAAGHDLDEFILDNIYKPQKGDAFVLPGFNLPVPHLIVCIMPSRKDTVGHEDVHLLRAYRHSLVAAQRMGLRRIAYPALGTGRRQYPVQRAARLALRGIEDRLNENTEEIRFVCDREDTLMAFAKRLKESGYLK